MSSVRTCPECGSELPPDVAPWLCPRCLLGHAAGDASNQPAALDGLDSTGPSGREVAGEAFPQRFGGYELLARIGQGGMGVVYKARQISLDRIVAVKVLPLGVLATKEQVRRFRTEAAAAGSLQHPNIVAIHEVGLCEDRHYLVMDFVEGQTLAELARAGPLRAARAARYVQKVAEAIHYAHERGILHRDLKPSNVMIDVADEPRITDFGLAKRLESGSDLTLSGQVLGSPQYMPPEQATGRQRQVGRRSDVYALGAMLYQLLTGRPPFVGETLSDILPQVVNDEPLRLRQLNPAVPADLETLCLKCLEKEMPRRYPTALALAEELGRYLRGEPIVARPVDYLGKAWRWRRRNPRLAFAIGVAGFSLVIGLAGVAWQWRRAELERQRAQTEAMSAKLNAYAADMKEVQRALEDSDLGRARELLDRHRPGADSALRTLHSAFDPRAWEWRYFWSRCQSDESSTLCRYSNYVSALAFSADGRWLAVRQRGGAVALWDADARRPVLELPGNDWRYYKAMAFSPRGNLLARGRRATDGTPVVSLLDANAQKETVSLPLSAPLWSVAFSPDGKLMASLAVDGTVRICEVASQKVVTQFVAGSLDLRLSTFMVSRVTESTPSEGTVTRDGLGGHAGTRTAPASNLFVLHYGGVLFSPDGRWLAVGEAKPRIRLLDRDTGEEKVIAVPPPADGITALAFSPDGHLLAAGCGALDHDVHLWDLVAGTELRLAGHGGWIAALAFSLDGQTLASASADQTLRLWDVTPQASPREIEGRAGSPATTHVISRGERRRLQGSADEIWALVWSPDGKSLVTGGRDGSVQYWDPVGRPTAAPDAVLPALIYPGGLGFLPDSKSFLTATRPAGDVRRWVTATLQVVDRLDFLGTNHISLALSKDARWLALGDAVGHIQVWDLPARRWVTNLVFNGVTVVLGFSAHDHLFGCGGLSPGGGIGMRLWKVPGWEEMSLQGIDLRGFEHGAVSPDERTVAVGYFDGKIAWWDLVSGTRLAAFDCPGASGGGVTVEFSPDGKLFAAAGFYGGVTLWDVASRQPRSIGRTFRNLLYQIAFSPDGRRVIASGSSPGAVLWLWDVQTGREVAVLPGEPGSYTTYFSPDGNTLCAVANGGSALFWRAPSFAEIEAGENKTTRR